MSDARFLKSGEKNENSVKKQEIIDFGQNRESIALISYGCNGHWYQDAEQLRTRIRAIIDCIVSFSELDVMMSCIQSIRDERVFIIISDKYATDILPVVHQIQFVDSIFILTVDKTNESLNLLHKYPKIINICTTMEELHISIKEQARIVRRQYETFGIFKHQRAIKDISKQFATNLWFQLFNNLILRFPHDDQAKQEMIAFCRQCYQNNQHEIRLIDKFEREYQSADAIRWYTKQSFLYKLINKALRTEDIDLLHTFRYYLYDLTENLVAERQNTTQQGETKFTAYRGTRLSNEELEQLKKNVGKILSSNGFWSTSRSREMALSFAPIIREESSDFVSIFFEIECNLTELDQSIVIADIAKYSELPDEQEILFGLNTSFRIESVDWNGELWLSKLIVSQENLDLTKYYIERMNGRTDELGIAIVYGRLFTKNGRYDKAIEYFENLLKHPNGEDIAWIEFSIGQAIHAQGITMSGREYYDSAYSLMLNAKPPRIKDSAVVLRAIGYALYRQGRYIEAIEYFEQVQQICDVHYASNHPLIYKNLNNIGLTYCRLGKYYRALEFNERAIAFARQHYKSDYIGVAISYLNIARTLTALGDFDEAFHYIEHAISIREKYYPHDHIFIAFGILTRAHLFCKQGKWGESLQEYNRALLIKKNHQSLDRIDSSWIPPKIGAILLKQGKVREAKEILEQGLQILEKIYPDVHSDISDCLDYLGHLYCYESDYARALDYYRRSLRIKYVCDLSHDHDLFARSLFYIGHVHYCKDRFRLALQYQNRALKMFKRVLPFSHPDITNTMKSIDTIQEKLNQSPSISFFSQ